MTLAAIEHFTGMLGDWFAYIRYKNLLRIIDRVEELHEQRNLKGKTIPIPPRYAIPLLQGASQEDNPGIQDLWANLIANATDPVKRIDLKKIYIDILSSLEPLDAKIMFFLADLPTEEVDAASQVTMNSKHIADTLGIPLDQVAISLQNLYRLGCLLDTVIGEFNTQAGYTSGLRVLNPRSDFRLSDLGRNLLKTCTAG